MNTAIARRWSLRTRLLLPLVTIAFGLFAASVTLSYLDYRRASQQLFDDSLRETAALLLQLAQHEIEEHGLSLGVALLKAEVRPGPYDFRYQIWTEDMRSAYRSANLPASPLMSISAQGLDWALVDGEVWRAYATWNSAHTLQIQIVQSQGQRLLLTRDAVLRSVAGVLTLLVVAVAFIWWVVSLSIRPLQSTARSVEARSPDDLRPVDDHGAPAEIAPLLVALNRLLERMREALNTERRFTADAAHELRTPLAAIRANAQVMVRARNQEELQSTAQDLIASVDRSTRIVEQLLALARADTQGLPSATGGDVDLATLLAGQLDEQQPLAAQRHIQIDAQLTPVSVDGNPALLTIMLRNLLDNAVRYTPAYGRVTVTCGPKGPGAELRVTDTGAGIPPTERERVFERFYRVSGTTEPGSGLGLSIVKRIADLHAARISVIDGAQGLGTTIVVDFPQAGP